MKKIHKYLWVIFCFLSYFSASGQNIDADSLMRVFKERREELNEKREQLRELLYRQTPVTPSKEKAVEVTKKKVPKEERKNVIAKVEKLPKEKKVRMKKMTVTDDLSEASKPKRSKCKKTKKKRDQSESMVETYSVSSDSINPGESVMSMMILDSIKIIENETRLVVRIASDVMKKNDHDITVVIDSILSLGTFSPAISEVVDMIVSYAKSYQSESYEDLSDDQAYIRHFVTFINDPGPHPSQRYYEDVWDTTYVFSYVGRKFEKSIRDTLTLVDKDHPYYRPCDIYTDYLYIGNAVSRNADDKRRYDYSCKCFKLDREYVHGGTDIRFNSNDNNPKVYAVFDGEVRIATYSGSTKNSGYGNVVVIRHYNGLETIYGHLNRYFVKSGDIVKAGDMIGVGGSTGGSTGRHLHFAMLVRGRPIDPESIINLEGSPKYKDRYIGTKPYGLCADQICVNEKSEKAGVRLKFRMQDTAVLKNLNIPTGGGHPGYVKP